jgi:hypothetical protein
MAAGLEQDKLFMHNFPRRKLVRIGIITMLAAIILVLAAGCSPIARPVQGDLSSRVSLSSGSLLGQTLVSRNNGLAGISLYLIPKIPGAGNLQVNVYPGPGRDLLLASGQIPLSSIDQSSYYTIDLPNLHNTYLQDYYIQLSITGDGTVEVGTGEAASYLDGSLYINDEPASGQLAFQLLYAFLPMAAGIARLFINWLFWMLVAIYLFVIPGLALLYLLWPDASILSFVDKLALSCGMSLAIYPIIFLLTYLFHLKLGIFIAFFPALLGIIYLIWRWRFADHFTLNQLKQKIDYLAIGTFVMVALILIFTRLWVIRTLVAPMWGDGFQHTMITQLIIDNQGLFDSWQPYAALTSFTYHFGFHTDAAVLHWLTGLDASYATLLAGQLVNILAVLSLYPLAKRLAHGSHWAGITAVVIGGFLSSMPMYYTNWGRYTQLTGQVILPVVIILFWILAEKPQSGWHGPALAGTAIGGLALTHYRVLIFALLALPLFLIFYLRRSNFRQFLSNYAVAGIVGALIFLPWFIHVYGGAIYSHLVSQLSTPAQSISASTNEYNSIQPLNTYLSTFLWVLTGFSLLWGFLRRQKEVVIFALWWLMLLLAANPHWLQLSGTGALSNFAIAIAIYIFAGVILGASVGWLTESNRLHGLRWSYAAIAVVLLLSSFYFGYQRLKDIIPAQFSLVTNPDVHASQWIQLNLPNDATFLVNSFFAYGDSVIVGSDAGWWLPLLAHRTVTTPPLTYGFESGPTPDYVAQVNALWYTVEHYGVTSQQAIDMLKKYGVHYVYIGQQNGSVNYSGPVILDADAMIASGEYKQVYHQDRVWILELNAY